MNEEVNKNTDENVTPDAKLAVDSEEANAAEPKAAESKPRNWAKLSAYIAGGLVLAGAVAYAAVRFLGGSDDSTESTESSDGE